MSKSNINKAQLWKITRKKIRERTRKEERTQLRKIKTQEKKKR